MPLGESPVPVSRRTLLHRARKGCDSGPESWRNLSLPGLFLPRVTPGRGCSGDPRDARPPHPDDRAAFPPWAPDRAAIPCRHPSPRLRLLAPTVLLLRSFRLSCASLSLRPLTISLSLSLLSSRPPHPAAALASFSSLLFFFFFSP